MGWCWPLWRPSSLVGMGGLSSCRSLCPVKFHFPGHLGICSWSPAASLPRLPSSQLAASRAVFLWCAEVLGQCLIRQAPPSPATETGSTRSRINFYLYSSSIHVRPPPSPMLRTPFLPSRGEIKFKAVKGTENFLLWVKRWIRAHTAIANVRTKILVQGFQNQSFGRLRVKSQGLRWVLKNTMR